MVYLWLSYPWCSYGLATHGVQAMACTHGASYGLYPWCTYGLGTHGVAMAYTHGASL